MDNDETEYLSRVFISYSRKDRQLVEPIISALEARKIDILRDTDDILPSEEWRGRLEDLIVEADQVLFALSAHSASSEVCAWEAHFAEQHHKRIAPVVIDELGDSLVPPVLSKLNYIFMTPPASVDSVLQKLVDALLIDIGWIREHARFSELSRDWERSDQQDDLHLRGSELVNAEQWSASTPHGAPSPTSLQMQFINSSRIAASRRLRRNVLVLGGLLILAVATSIVAWIQFRQAQDESKFSSDFTAVMLNTSADPLRANSTLPVQEECKHYLEKNPDGSKNTYGLFASYCGVRNVLRLSAMQKLANKNLFLSGPHKAADLIVGDDVHDFGRYNPEFVDWIADRIIPEPADQDFINATQDLYDEFLKYMVRAFYLTYRKSAEHVDFFKYERQILHHQITDESATQLQDNGDGPSLLDFYEIDSQYPAIVFDFTALGFESSQITVQFASADDDAEKLYDTRAPIRYWLRRSIDGSAGNVFKLIEKVLLAYDPQFAVEQGVGVETSFLALPAYNPDDDSKPYLLDLPLQYRKPWGEDGGLMPEAYVRGFGVE